MVNHYIGNTGQVRRIDEPASEQRHAPEIIPSHSKKPPPKRSGGGLDRSIQRFMHRLSPERLEQEDLLLMLILYLLYRESGNREFLITLGAFLLF